jgi:hypothetical protein
LVTANFACRRRNSRFAIGNLGCHGRGAGQTLGVGAGTVAFDLEVPVD